MKESWDLNGCFKKSRIRTGFGVFLVLFALTWMFWVRPNTTLFAIIGWIAVLCFLLYGIVHIAGGNGYLLEGFFINKPYFSINDETVDFKIVGKEQSINWRSIKEIEHRKTTLRFDLWEHSSKTIMLNCIDQVVADEMVMIVKKTAADKKINFIEFNQ